MSPKNQLIGGLLGAFALVPVLVLGSTGVADAHRAASTSETSAMVYEASGRYYGGLKVDEPRSAPLRCFVADVSTVTGGSSWGAWTFSSYAYQPSHERQCQAGNGVAIAHQIGGQWYVLWEGSEGYPPTHTARRGSMTLQGVPRAVAEDLISGLSSN